MSPGKWGEGVIFCFFCCQLAGKGHFCDDYHYQVEHIEVEYKEACEYRYKQSETKLHLETSQQLQNVPIKGPLKAVTQA